MTPRTVNLQSLALLQKCNCVTGKNPGPTICLDLLEPQRQRGAEGSEKQCAGIARIGAAIPSAAGKQQELSCAQGDRSVFVLLTCTQVCFSKSLHIGR